MVAPVSASAAAEARSAPQGVVRVDLSPEILLPAALVGEICKIRGPVDVYTWYEGPHSLPMSGARFMREELLQPLYKLKPNAKIFLHSLKAWDFTKTVSEMPLSTPLGDAINRIHTLAIHCIYSTSFFRFAKRGPQHPLHAFLSAELPKKEWLQALSAGYKPSERTVGKLFDDAPSLFDCLRDRNAASAYSAFQYVESYYLLRQSVARALQEQRKEVDVVFMLANDEAKYYRDFPTDAETMLTLEFGEQLKHLTIHVRFYFFRYLDSLKRRPYIDKNRHAEQVKPEDVPRLFDFVTPPDEEENKIPFLRDEIHRMHDWQ
jgi:hypothetical protein